MLCLRRAEITSRNKTAYDQTEFRGRSHQSERVDRDNVLKFWATQHLNLLSSIHSINITLASRGFRHAGPSLWNSLPHHLRSTDSYTVFKSNLNTHIFSGANISGP